MTGNHLDKNPLDPLRAGPKRGREIFELFYKISLGFDRADVLDATANLIVNLLRELCPTREKALTKVDQFAALLKGLIDKHYTATGRRNIFPHTQNIDVPHIDFTKKG